MGITGIFILLQEPGAVYQGVIHRGVTPMVFLTVCIQAISGVFISLVVRHTSNITKCFVSAMCIILTIGIDFQYMNIDITLYTITGCILVVAATVAYTLVSGTN